MQLFDSFRGWLKVPCLDFDITHFTAIIIGVHCHCSTKQYIKKEINCPAHPSKAAWWTSVWFQLRESQREGEWAHFTATFRVWATESGREEVTRDLSRPGPATVWSVGQSVTYTAKLSQIQPPAFTEQLRLRIISLSSSSPSRITSAWCGDGSRLNLLSFTLKLYQTFHLDFKLTDTVLGNINNLLLASCNKGLCGGWNQIYRISGTWLWSELGHFQPQVGNTAMFKGGCTNNKIQEIKEKY